MLFFGCGDDFSGCASVAAFDSTNTRGRGATATTYEIKGSATSISIQASTYDILLSKKPLCESVTKQCQNVASQVWDTFLREVAPQVKSAELIAEDNARQNCIGNISSCFQQACRDTIDPNDPDGSYDMCLTRPETMLNLCQVPLNACGINTTSAAEAQESDIWDFVVARLASMRVNSCSTQVKECLQSEDRCGPDYSQCIGLDVKAVSQMCPIEALTACQQVDSEGNKLVTSIEDIEDMIWGIYLSIDNALLDQCQKAVDDKMIEICGDVNDCAAFTDDNVMGTESLLSYTDSNGNYVIDGLVSFGNVEVLKSSVKSENYPGGEYATYAIDINNYREHLDVNDPSAARVVSALESVANKIAQKIAILRQDPDIQMCVEGRNLYQVNRGANATARFPYLLDSSIMTIVSSGLDQARQNYNRKYDELVESALESQSDQIKSVLCASMASSGGPQCASYITVDGEAICETYEAPKLDAVFGNTDDSQNKIGVNGNDIYSTKYVIAGADISEWASAVQSGRSEYTQVDSMGNMLGKITMSSVYSAANDTCTITTTTTMCDTMEALVLSSTSTSCGSGGIQILGGSGCSGAGGGLISIGGGGKKTTTTQTYAGTQCTSFMDPVTTTNTIKM